MKRISIVAILFSIGIWLSFPVSSENRNLYKKFRHKPEIRIFLKEVLNEKKNPEVDIAIYKDVFKEVLEKRIGMKFVYVGNGNDADVIIKCIIKNYIFVEKAMPSFLSIEAMVADLAAPKSAAKLIVDYEIINPETNKPYLIFKNFTTEIRKPREDMKGKMGFINACEKNINRFIYRAFYKQKHG